MDGREEEAAAAGRRRTAGAGRARREAAAVDADARWTGGAAGARTRRPCGGCGSARRDNWCRRGVVLSSGKVDGSEGLAVFVRPVEGVQGVRGLPARSDCCGSHRFARDDGRRCRGVVLSSRGVDGSQGLVVFIRPVKGCGGGALPPPPPRPPPERSARPFGSSR